MGTAILTVWGPREQSGLATALPVPEVPRGPDGKRSVSTAAVLGSTQEDTSSTPWILEDTRNKVETAHSLVEEIWIDTQRRWLSTSQGERPQKKLTLLTS